MDLSRTRLEGLINEYVFDEKGRKMIKRFWFDNASYETIAEELKISVSTVKRNMPRYELTVVKYI